jgi:hypothetical protein
VCDSNRLVHQTTYANMARIANDLDTLRENFLLLTYDSCRYDVLMDANTPVLDSFGEILSAQSPACFTYAAHHAFFVGIFPYVVGDVPYYNRFNKQLLSLQDVGEVNVAKSASYSVQSDHCLLSGLRDIGYLTVGAGAMTWFQQKSLINGFDSFLYTGTNAQAQIDFLLKEIDIDKPYFGFINFGETHAPYSYSGKIGSCPVQVRARNIHWPPIETGDVGKDCPAYQHQLEAAEYLDSLLPQLFSNLSTKTTVIVCADHGECFGEDGYWGHGINHPIVWEVPLAIFRLDGREVGTGE